MSTAAIVLMVVGIPVAILLWLVFLMALIFGIFHRTSGWQALAERYAAGQEPVGTVHKRQTVKVGAVRWRWSMTVGLSEQGLYLAPSLFIGPLRALAKHPPVLIPWSDIHVVGPGHIYLLWECTELAVGNPRIATITVPNGLLELLGPYLGAQNP